MKSAFNTTWKASKQPRKQRKYSFNAPLHLRSKFMAATLDKPLRERYGIRNIEVRKGDEVKIMRGKFKGKDGKVGTSDVQRTRLSIDGIERSKKEGSKVAVWFHPSNVKIIELNLDDSRRLNKDKKREKKEGKEVKKESNEVKKEEKKAEKVTKTEPKQKPVEVKK